MDGFRGKRTSVPIMPRKASGFVLHENMKKKDDKSVPICSRIGCSSRISSIKGAATIDHTKKPTVSSFRPPSNGKEIVGSSSGSISGFVGGTTKASKVTGRRQLSSHDETQRALPRGKKKTTTTKESIISVHSDDSSSVSGEVVTEVGSSSRGNTKSNLHQRPDLVTRDARASLNRHGLRDSRSKTETDVLPSSLNPTRKTNVFRKKTSDGESSSSSSSRGDKTDRSVIEVKNQSCSPNGNGNGITMSESRRNRNLPSVRDNSVVSSTSTRSSTGYCGRTGRSGAAVATLRAPQPATRRADLNPSRPAQVSHSPLSNSYTRPMSSNGRLRSMMMPGSPSGSGLSRSLMNREGFRRYNMNGVAEVLLALERIEQNEELTYEQLVVLETNLFLNGVSSFHDQHRDMRLDIDNMSYEELLALEEKMGTVSTALSEEALLKSLKSSIYRPADESGDICLNKDDDVKCSICQEEYVDGDEVGTLPCQHMYHVNCAQQWLRMKNWCPICKTSAESKPQPFS